MDFIEASEWDLGYKEDDDKPLYLAKLHLSALQEIARRDYSLEQLSSTGKVKDNTVVLSEMMDELPAVLEQLNAKINSTRQSRGKRKRAASRVSTTGSKAPKLPRAEDTGPKKQARAKRESATKTLKKAGKPTDRVQTGEDLYSSADDEVDGQGIEAMSKSIKPLGEWAAKDKKKTLKGVKSTEWSPKGEWRPIEEIEEIHATKHGDERHKLAPYAFDNRGRTRTDLKAPLAEALASTPNLIDTESVIALLTSVEKQRRYEANEALFTVKGDVRKESTANI